MPKHSLSIWFLIGLQLTIYGLLIFVAGVWDYFVPPAHPPVMAWLHPAIWWGLFMFALGVFYIVRFRGRSTDV